MIKSLAISTLTVVLFLLSFSNVHAFSQPDSTGVLTWKEMMDSTVYYESLQNYRESLKWAKSALKLIDTLNYSDTNLIDNLEFIYVAYSYLGIYDSSITYLNRYSKKVNDFYGEFSKEYAMSLNALGNNYLALGNYKESEFYLRKALEIRRNIFKGDNLAICYSLSNLAGLFFETGRMELAEKFFIEDLEMIRRIFKKDNWVLAMTINNLAMFYKSNNNHFKSGPLFEESISIIKNLKRVDSSALATILENYGLHCYEATP